MRQRDLGFLPFFSRFLAFLRAGGRSDHLLPNVARYQLRHTPMIEFAPFIIAEFGGLVKTGAKKGFEKGAKLFFFGGLFLCLPFPSFVGRYCKRNHDDKRSNPRLPSRSIFYAARFI